MLTLIEALAFLIQNYKKWAFCLNKLNRCIQITISSHNALCTNCNPGYSVSITVKGINNVDKHLCWPKFKVTRSPHGMVHFEGTKCLQLELCWNQINKQKLFMGRLRESSIATTFDKCSEIQSMYLREWAFNIWHWSIRSNNSQR